MKTNNRIADSTSLLLMLLFSLVWCCRITEPTDNIKLEIKDGYYQVINESPNEIKCSISFKYRVKGSVCKVGGYGIDWDDIHGGLIDWYKMQTLIPNHTYSISDTFYLSNKLTSAPVVMMQGYFENSSESDPKLRGRCVLRKK